MKLPLDLRSLNAEQLKELADLPEETRAALRVARRDELSIAAALKLRHPFFDRPNTSMHDGEDGDYTRWSTQHSYIARWVVGVDGVRVAGPNTPYVDGADVSTALAASIASELELGRLITRAAEAAQAAVQQGSTR